MLEYKYRFDALGTKWVIETNDEINSFLKTTIQNRIEEFDKVYSRFRVDSLITKVAKKSGEYLFPQDAKKLFDFYKNLYVLTNGKITPLIGDMISRAGYDAVYSLKPQLQEPVPAWDEATHWNDVTLTTSQQITLDVGAAGKGYMIDIIAAILDEHSVDDYIVDASGDLRHKGAGENIVGLEDPLDSSKVIGTVEVINRSLCASASNRRAWGDGMHHILDPTKIAPTKDIIATWVIAEEAMVADGLATALFFVDAKKLCDYDFEYVRMYANGSVEYSTYFEKKLFKKLDAT